MRKRKCRELREDFQGINIGHWVCSSKHKRASNQHVSPHFCQLPSGQQVHTTIDFYQGLTTRLLYEPAQLDNLL